MITSEPQDTIINQGDTFSYTFVATDIDPGDNVTLSAPVLPSWMTFDPATGVLEGTATNDQVQFSADSSFSVQLKATDNSSVSVTQEFSVRVVNVNDPPAVTSQNDISIDRNTTVDIGLSDLTINDPDNKITDLKMIILSGTNYTFSGNTITPNENYYGDLTVNTEITDITDTISYGLTIHVNFVNIDPEFTSTPVTTAMEGSAYAYLVTASDIDISDPNQSQSLHFWAKSIPSWMTFNTTNNILSGVPENADVGTDDVSIAVSDGVDTVYQNFQVVVANVNDPPVITGQQTLTGTKNANITITPGDLVITDPDNVPADMTVIVLAGDHYTFDGNVVYFEQDYLGTITVNVKVNDGFTDSNLFQVTVTVEKGVGIPQITGQFINKVYPNPANDVVVFELNGNNPDVLEIRDLTGKVVVLRKLEKGSTEVRLSVSDLSKGVYIYRIYDKEHYQIGKLMVE